MTWENVAKFIREPLRQLPPEFQLPTWRFWSYFADVLDSQLGLASRISYWIEFDGLTLDELVAAFDRMRKTACEYPTRFKNEVLDSLEKAIADVRKAERVRVRKAAEKEQYDGPDATPEEIAEARAAIDRLCDTFGIPRIRK